MSDERIKFIIEKHIATIATSAKGWTKELNLVSWNGAKAKYDFREWDPDHDKMGKGVTFTEEEARLLFCALASEIKGEPKQAGTVVVTETDDEPKAKPKKAEPKPEVKVEDIVEVEKVEAEVVEVPAGLPPELLAQIEAAKKAMGM